MTTAYYEQIVLALCQSQGPSNADAIHEAAKRLVELRDSDSGCEDVWHEQDTFTHEQADQLVGREVQMGDGRKVTIGDVSYYGVGFTDMITTRGLHIFANTYHQPKHPYDIVAYKGSKIQ